MNQMKNLYNVVHHINENTELPNYFPPRIYADVEKLKYQRQKKQMRYLKDKPKKKLDLNCIKHTFIQQIQHRQKKLPSPHTYDPTKFELKQKKGSIFGRSERITLFQQVNKQNKKNPSPSPCHYEAIKCKQKSNSLMSFYKAQNTNCVDAAMYVSNQSPGVGQYNMRRSKSLNKFGKFDKAKKSENQKQNRLPSAVTYYPKLMDKKLFNEIKKQKNSRPNFPREKRFESKKDNENKNLFYAGISEWGMKTNYKKKDILDILSTHNIYSKSVYYH